MRPSTGLSYDGDLNLFEAVRVAADEASAGMGVLVVFNDVIHSARDVTKTSTYRVETFQGRDLGPLGFADNDGRVVFYHRVVRRHTTSSMFDVSAVDNLPRVDLVLSGLEADGIAIDAFVAARCQGIVCAGTGAGRPTPKQEAAFDRAREAGVVVCMSSRVGSGRSVRSPSMTHRGWIAADNLQPWKARILLQLALMHSRDPDVIQQIFDEY
jgi:L-asparaginase